jgi:hypothetical protein
MIKIDPEDLPEAVTTLYLRLNGFFTSGLVLHSEVKGLAKSDIDCLAVWHPFHDQSEREVDPDPFLELGTRRELLLCEIKSSAPALSFNEPLRTDRTALDAVLRWSGLVPPAEIDATVNKLLPQLQDTATLEDARAGIEVGDVRIRALLCCPGCGSDARATRWCVRGPEMLAYINLCLNPSVPRPRCSTQYPLKLWGGFLAPLVEYVKALPSNRAPSFADLRKNITSIAGQ